MKRKVGLVAIMALCSASAFAAPARKTAPAACPVDRVIYAQPGVVGVTAGFTKQRVRTSYASDLVFFIKAAGQTFWYDLSSPNGYGGSYITPQSDPKLVKAGPDEETPDPRLPAYIPIEGKEGEEASAMMFDAFDAKMTAFAAPPMSGKPAPAFLYARELGPLFHYNHMTNLYALKSGVEINIALWGKVGCAPKAH